MRKFTLLFAFLLTILGGTRAWAQVTDDFSGYPTTTSGTTLGDNWEIYPGTSNYAHFATSNYDYGHYNGGSGDESYVYGYSTNKTNNVWLVLKKQVTGDVVIKASNGEANTDATIWVTKFTNENNALSPVSGAEQSYTIPSRSAGTTKTYDAGSEPTYIGVCVVAVSSGSNAKKVKLLEVTYTEYVDAGAIAKPTDFTVTSTTYNSASFSWTAGGTETAWELVYGASGFDKDQAMPISVTTNPYTLTGLTENSTYDAYLRATDGTDVSSWTSKVTFTTPAQYPAPTGFSAGAYTATTQTFSWTNGSTETAWQIKYSTDENFNPDTQGTNQNVTTKPYTLKDLTTETTYYAYIRADYGNSHYSAWSEKISFTPSATMNTTINDGTTTNYYIPVYGNWVDNVNYNKSQFVIPSSSLSAVNGREITKLTFYTTASNAISWAGNVFDVYMKETTATTVSTTLDRTGTKVFTGSLSVQSDGTMEVTLSENFSYSGDNLLIGFDMTTKGSYVSAYFYGITGASGSSMYTSNGTGTNTYFLPKMTITSVPGAVVAVKKPKNLEATSVLATSATLGWTNGDDETAWQVALGTTENFDPDGVTPINANANPFTVTGLTSEATYYAYVRAKKGNDVSDWSNKVSFTTPNAKPSDVAVAAADISATFSWTANAGESAWQIKYSTTASFDPDSEGTLQAVTTNPYTLTGLTPETTYYAYLRADLGGGSYSGWTAKQTFTTGFDHELTVNEGNGNTTSGSVPFEGPYTDNAARGWSQFIIPASQIETMSGGSVNKITFYTTEGITWNSGGNPTFEVYLKEVDNEKFASKEFIDWTTMTKIYDGEIAFDGSQLVFNLANAYTYNGKNLMVGFKQTVAGGWCNISWLGTSADDEVGVQNANTSPTVNVNWAAFLPKTTFNYETVTGPRLAVSTDALDFGEITQSSTAEDKQKTFTISNTGVQELTGLSVAVSGAGYSVSALPRTNITTTGENSSDIELTVTFAPTTSGSYNGTVTVSATNQPDKVINLSANYVADPILGVFNDDQASEAATTGQTINFGYAQAAPTYTYYIKNTGAGTLDVAVTDGGLTVSPASASLAAGEQQAFTITPNVANADATVTFTGTNHDGGATVGTFAVTLQGTVMPLTETFFEDFAYAAGEETPDATTELPGWEINNSENNIKFYHSTIYYYASSIETANVITPKLRVSGTSDVLRISAYTAYTYSSSKLIISYSADKTNWTVAATKTGNTDFDNKTYVLKDFEISDIPEGSYYFKIEMCDVAVDYFYGFSSILPAAVTLAETEAPTLVSGVRDVTLTYTPKARWNTIAVPFALTSDILTTIFGDGYKIFEFDSYDNDVIAFKPSTSFSAGNPYLVYIAAAPTNAGDVKEIYNVDISATEANSVLKNGVTFQSTYAPIAKGGMTGFYGVTSDGEIRKAGSGASLKGFRAYFTGVPASANARIMIVEDTVTGIGTLKQDSQSETVYNLNGQRVQNVKKGSLYIVNGKKQVAK